MRTSAFQQAIESVENLSLEDQEILLDLLQKRLNQASKKNQTIPRNYRSSPGIY